MTLQIHQIYYDHSLEVNTYSAGVLSIDSVTKRMYVHDGFTPNGNPLPIMLDLEEYAKTTLDNVSQEDITKLLSTYGALSLNDKNPITTEQRDNVYDKLRLDGMVSTETIPEKNSAYIDSSTRELKTKDLTAEPIYWGYNVADSAGIILRTAGVPYTATRDCGVVVGFNWGGDRAGTNSASLTVDGEELWCSSLTISAKYPTSVVIKNVTTIPVYKGQTYTGTGTFSVFKEIPANYSYKNS